MYKALVSFTMNKNVYKEVDVKKGEILAEDFATEDVINDLLNAGHIIEYDGSLEITENGTYDVREYESADVNVSSTPASLQSKEVSITENGTTTVTADSGYDGLSQVNVTTNVSSSGSSNSLTFITPGSTNDKGINVSIAENVPAYAFQNESSTGTGGIIREVELKDGITIIGERSFQSNEKLTVKNQKLPNSITTIGAFAFIYCSMLDINELPSSLTGIEVGVFQNCNMLKIKKIPSSVKYIYSQAFYRCNSLVQISMDSVELLIGSSSANGAFYQCASLKAVWIGSSITGIGRHVFNNCNQLSKIYIDLPRATVESFTNYGYAFMNNANKTGIIVCNDDEGFMTKAEFDAIDWSSQ